MRTLLVLLSFPALICSQEPAYRVQTRLVIVPATVTDSRGGVADGLDRANFLLLDNGVPQQINLDTTGTGVAPVALVITVQTSGISAAALDHVRRTAAMIQPLITGERGCAAVLSFHSYIRLVQPCTKDQNELEAAFNRLQPGDPKQARLIDAVDTAVEYLATLPQSRRALLLISESRDRGSESDLATAVAKAQSAGVSVYAITYSAFRTGVLSKALRAPDPPRPLVERPKGTETEALTPRGRVPIPPPAQRVDLLGVLGELFRLGKVNAAEALARATGGNVLSFARLQGLESALAGIGAELQSQYVLSYTPTAPEPGYHRLEVQIRGRSESLQVRTRPGYWSATPE